MDTWGGPNVGNRRDLDFSEGKQFAGARRGFHFAVPEDVFAVDVVFRFQNRDEPFDGGQLRGRGRLFVKVPDEGNADAVLVVFLRSGVRAVELLAPAEGGFNFAIAHAVAVADDEVITDP